MTSAIDTATEKLGRFPYVLGGMSFIPLIGIIFGIIAIIWGLVTKKHGGLRLAAIGATGIGFTIILYGGLYYFAFMQRGGIYDDLRTKLAQSEINSLVQSIEFYKVQHGSYPKSLKVLQESLSKDSYASVFAFDPTNVKPGGKPRYFFYKRVGRNHYYLRGLGPDGQPFTPDDIVPQISPRPGGKVGLLLKHQPNS